MPPDWADRKASRFGRRCPCAIAVQITSVLLVMLNEKAVGGHVVAGDDQPVSAVLSVQPTPLPWSARQAQMSSRMVLFAADGKANVGLARLRAANPEKRHPAAQRGQSWNLGRAEFRNCRSRGEFGIPASEIIPETITPVQEGRSSTRFRSPESEWGNRFRALPYRDV